MNAILTFIGASSLTDEEFESLEVEDQEYTSEVYEALLGVLDARELVSNTRDRLTSYFTARGVSVTETAADDKTNILVGGVLCE